MEPIAAFFRDVVQPGLRPTLAAVEIPLVALQAVKVTKPYSLIVIDAHMPEMDGSLLPSESSRSFAALDVMLTSAGQPGDARRCR
jgi:CheY-like chemotaxis protein